MEAKIFCIGRNLGGNQSRDRAAGVGVEIETGSLAALEPEERSACNHCRVVGRQSRTRRKNRSTLWLESGSHRRRQSFVAGNSTAEYDALAGESGGGTRSLLDQRVDHGILEAARDVGFVGVDIFRIAHGIQHRRLEAAERERVVIVVTRLRVLPQHRPRKSEAPRISSPCQLLDVASARIRQNEQLGDLVESFAGSVVASGAEHSVFPPGFNIEQLSVTAGDEQRGEWWNGVAMLECGSEEVPFHMMDTEQRDVAREGERLSVADADEQGAYKSGGVGDRNRIEIIEAKSGFAQGAIDDRNDAGEMRPRGNLRDDAAEHAMDVLRENHQRFLTHIVAVAFQHGSRRLVT